MLQGSASSAQVAGRCPHLRRHGEVQTVRNGVRKDLREIPRVRRIRGQHTVDRERHDSAVVQQRDNQHHERREVKLVSKGQDAEAYHDTDRHRTGINGVVTHTLEDDTRPADGVDT